MSLENNIRDYFAGEIEQIDEQLAEMNNSYINGGVIQGMEELELKKTVMQQNLEEIEALLATEQLELDELD